MKKPEEEDSHQTPTARLPPRDGDDDSPTVAASAAGTAGVRPSVGGRLAVTPFLVAGQVLAGRFRIIRFIAQGGMGEVYEAEDRELRERVALKTIRPEIAQDSRAMARFKREVQLSRKVTHPNVCRIFDIFRDPGASSGASSQGEITFLTMELLSGETLADRLNTVGRFSTAQALPLVVQMAAGLDAAHGAGVVHRDFKGGNVLLVASDREGGGTRAVVTDFGLANANAATEEALASLTGTGWIAGTPAYMSPEQVEGGDITPASDVYSLGVVIYEMVTGKRPFVGDTPLSAAVKRLKQVAPSPLTHAPDLDPAWAAVILRCLERDPSDRFAAATDVVRALSGEAVVPGRRAVADRRRRTRLAVGGAAVLLLLALAGTLIRSRLRLASAESAARPAASAVARRRSVAVLGFKNLSTRPEAAWLSAALSEMLTTELAAGEKLRTISGENVSRAKIELSLADAESLARDTLAGIRRNLGADFVVLGSYLALGKESGGQIRLDLRLQDAGSGETVASVAEVGTEADFLGLVSRAGARLREKLGVAGLSTLQVGGLRASQPSSPEAARLYSEGLARLRVFDALKARELLERAVASDPAYPLAHSALAAAWSDLGYDVKAKEEAKRAFDLSTALSREERLSVEARYHEATHEWEKASAIYQTLWTSFPDNLEYGLRLGATQIADGKRKEAVATALKLRKLPGPDGEDPRIDLTEAEAAGSLADYKTEQAAAQSALTKARSRGASLLAAEALIFAGSAASSLGDPSAAATAYEKARQAYAAAGDRGGVARALMSTATDLYKQGELENARKLTDRCLAIQQEIGNESGVASALNTMANIEGERGNIERAIQIHEQAMEHNRRIGNQRQVAGALGNIASLLQYKGDLVGARRKHEEALAIFREVGEKNASAIELTNIASLLALGGDLGHARALSEQALAIKKEVGNRSSMAFSLIALGDVIAAQGDLAGARKRYEEALKIRTELGQAGRVAETQLALAWLCLEEGKAVEGGLLAREAAEQFVKEKEEDAQAQARAALARALLAQRKAPAALGEMNRARELSKKSEDRGARLTIAIAGGRVQMSCGDPAGAVKSLEAALAQGEADGLYSAALEIRLALGEAEIKSGSIPAGRARLESVQRDASARGFGLIARKAARARG